MKIITNLIIFLIFTTFIFSIKIKDEPYTDSQWRQANVPPTIAVIIDMPSYSKKDLFKWSDFIESNTNLISKNIKKNDDIIHKSYSDKLLRMGLLRNKIDSTNSK